MSLKARLLTAVISLVVLNVIIMGVGSINVSVSRANDAQTEALRARLTSQSVQTSTQLKSYFNTIESLIKEQAASMSVVEASRSFVAAFGSYARQRSTVSASESDVLSEFYASVFDTSFREKTGRKPRPEELALNSLSDSAMRFQYDFMASTPFAPGSKDELVDVGNETRYAQLHSRFHPHLRRFIRNFGFYDLFIVDIGSGDIVYSVFKETDFATNLNSGAFNNSALGHLFKQVSEQGQPGDVYFSDFRPYAPSYNAMAGFVASPVYDNGRAVAVLILQLPLERINNILTHEQKWKASGYGVSGQTVLLSSSGAFLSEHRHFVESPDAFIRQLPEGEVRNNINNNKTTVGLLTEQSDVVRRVFSAESGFFQHDTGSGPQRFLAYSTLTIGSEQYAVVAQIDKEEGLQATDSLAGVLLSSMFVETIIQIVIASVVIMWFANKLVLPLERLGRRCQELIDGEGDLTVQIKPSGIPEIDKISDNFNVFIDQMRQIIAQVKGDADALAIASSQLKKVTVESEHTAAQQREQTRKVSSAIEVLSDSVSDVSLSTEQTSEQSLEAQGSLKENMSRADLAADNIKLLVDLLQDSSEVITNLKTDVVTINKMLETIRSIADQTNLLALNAAIEAARAGEAGRGFSVVADEVRSLANRSQENTEEISKLVEKMNQTSDISVERMERAEAAAGGGIHLVDLVSDAMNELAANLRQVLDLTAKINQATTEQNRTSGEVLTSAKQISDMAVEVENGAHQTTESADELARIAEHAQSLVARFKV